MTYNHGPERIRVMQVTHDLGIGGLPRVVETLCRHLDPARYELEVLCLRDGGPLADRLEASGVPSFIMPQRKTVLRADYFTPFTIAKHIRERRPAIVHTHNTQPFVEAGLAAKLVGTPVLIHTDHARDFPDKWRYMFAERVMSHMSNKVVAVSDQGKADLRKYVHVPEAKLTTIVNGVDAGDVSTEGDGSGFRQKAGIPLDAKVIGLGARFSEQKGISYLLRAMPTVLERHPESFVVLAGYGPLEKMLKDEARELGIADRVRFVGKVNSMSEVLPALDVFALPSLWEGLPMAILEAMAARVPIVATTVGGVGGALTDGHTALLVPPRDPAAFAGALTRALSSSDLRRSLAGEARSAFDRRFSAAAMARAYSGLYESALKRH